MKKKIKLIVFSLAIFASGVLLSAFIFNAEKSVPVLGSNKIAQIGIIVKDIEKASEMYASLFGFEIPEIILAENPVDNPTLYRGKLTDGSCKLAFFSLENIQIELIQPVGGPSTWNDYLEKTGGGIHHIGIWVKGMDGKLKMLESLNIEEVQRGGWDGGQYSYAETPEEMGIIVELLENYNQKD